MTESSLHLHMVKQLKSILENKIGSERVIIFCDDGMPNSQPPPIIGKTRPDIYANDPIDDFHVIGEAKTWPDLKTQRSKQQIHDQLQFLSNHEKHLFLLIVPYGFHGAGSSVVRECRSKLINNNLHSEVIEYIPS